MPASRVHVHQRLLTILYFFLGGEAVSDLKILMQNSSITVTTLQAPPAMWQPDFCSMNLPSEV